MIVTLGVLAGGRPGGRRPRRPALLAHAAMVLAARSAAAAAPMRLEVMGTLLRVLSGCLGAGGAPFAVQGPCGGVRRQAAAV